MDNVAFSSDSKSCNSRSNEAAVLKVSNQATLLKVSKLQEAENGAMELNSLQGQARESFSQKEGTTPDKKPGFFTHPKTIPCDHIPKKYSYIFRLKSKWELIALSGTVCGIEFCYAAETAFVTPVLLSLGLNIKFVTMIWCLSPLVGFFLTPILGSFSDTCESRFGRRRPYILLLSVGIIVGLILVPNGQRIGVALGDKSNSLIYSEIRNDSQEVNGSFDQEFGIYKKEASSLTELQKFSSNETYVNIPSSNHSIAKRNVLMHEAQNNNRHHSFLVNENKKITSSLFLKPDAGFHLRQKRFASEAAQNGTSNITIKNLPETHVQSWSLVFTVIGTVLLDSCSDACQSPSRAYLLDVCIPDDHTTGLSTFTFMAGFGGTIGYLMGAMHWEATTWGHLLGGQVHVVFIIITIIFVICLIATLCSFPEIPLWVLRDPKMLNEYNEKIQSRKLSKHKIEITDCKQVASSPEVGSSKPIDKSYSDEMQEVKDFKRNSMQLENNKNETQKIRDVEAAMPSEPTLKEYLKSIVVMPYSLRILCLTNLVGWMALVSYSLYFSDFVGECVYGGDPQAPEGSESYIIYKEGVRFACWGMALYSFSCSLYSYFIEALVKKVGAKKAYVGGQMAYAIGMIIMAISKHPAAVILLSPTAGIMYSSLFTIPYVLLSYYHSTKKFHEGKKNGDNGVRGMGTDVAIVSSMVFLSQFILSLTMGSIVEAVGSNVATVYIAAVLSAVAAILATQIVYYDT